MGGVGVGYSKTCFVHRLGLFWGLDFLILLFFFSGNVGVGGGGVEVGEKVAILRDIGHLAGIFGRSLSKLSKLTIFEGLSKFSFFVGYRKNRG